MENGHFRCLDSTEGGALGVAGGSERCGRLLQRKVDIFLKIKDINTHGLGISVWESTLEGVQRDQ